MSRPIKEYQINSDYLKILLSNGPVAVKAIKQQFWRGWRTVEKAKKELGVKSIHTPNGWAWYLSDVNPELDKPNAIPPAIQGVLSPGDEPEEDTPIDTAGMIRTARMMHLSRHDHEDEICRQLTADCKLYPQTPPYSQEYIRAVVNHVVFGHALPSQADSTTKV